MHVFPAEDFPQIKDLENHVDIFREEYRNVSNNILPINRINRPPEETFNELISYINSGGEYGWFENWGFDANPNPNWTQYAITIYDAQLPFARTPKTQEIVSKLTGIKSVAFIRMGPHTTLPFHTHPDIAAEGMLQAHMLIDGPSTGSFLVVNSEIVPHSPGKMIIFDGSFYHTAFNSTNEVRTILYVEFLKSAHVK